MRIVHVISSLTTGGAETCLLRLCRGELAAGHHLLVISVRAGGPIADELSGMGIPVVGILGKAEKGTIVGLRRALRECTRLRPDVIIGWMYHGIFVAHLLARLRFRSARLIWNIRCTIDDMPNWRASTRWLISGLRRLSGAADTIIFNSIEGQRQHEAYGYRSSCPLVIENGVEIDRFRVDPNVRSAVRAELGIGAREFAIGHVARFHPMKSQLGLVDAVRQIKVARPVVLVLAGPGLDAANPVIGPLLRDCPWPANVRVLTLGERRDVARLLSSFDAFCLTSRGGEGCPNAVLEAMAAAVPCIVTDAGDSARLVGDPDWVIGIGEWSALVDRLEKLIALNPQQRQAIGRRLATRATQHFSLERMLDRYESAIAG
ncbi:MAG: glycosyltransferase [Proteobacteria bacterium]|nr:glycosyltransferase [Pseudomonadota bacterium]